MIIVASKGAYVMGNAAFWISAGGPPALAGRWFTLSPSRASTLISSLAALSPANLPRCLGEGIGTLSFAGHTTVDGWAALAIRDTGNVPGGAPGELDIAAGTPHLPLRLTATGATRAGGTIDVCNTGQGSETVGRVTLGEFGRVPTITAPANAEQLGGSQPA